MAKSKLFTESSFELGYLTLKARLSFAKLRRAFINTLIFHHFDSEYYIYIKTDLFSYDISRVLNPLTLDNLGQRDLMTFFLRKMIIAETQYKTHDSKLLAIIETFKLDTII